MVFTLKDAVAVITAMNDGDVSELSSLSDTDEDEQPVTITKQEEYGVGGAIDRSSCKQQAQSHAAKIKKPAKKVAKCRSKPGFKPSSNSHSKSLADVEPDSNSSGTEEYKVEGAVDTSSCKQLQAATGVSCSQAQKAAKATMVTPKFPRQIVQHGKVSQLITMTKICHLHFITSNDTSMTDSSRLQQSRPISMPFSRLAAVSKLTAKKYDVYLRCIFLWGF